MRVLLRSALVFGLVALGPVLSSRADVVTLTFEGLQNGEQILGYYNGGLGGNYGITFGPDALALNAGNYSGNPSSPGILFFQGGTGAIMNVAAGFTTNFSLYYSAPTNSGVATIYDGLNGTGNVLATLNLLLTPQLPGNGTETYNNWVSVGVTFPGTAMSVNFSGAALIAFDNVALGSDTPSGAVPEPSSMVLAGLGCLGTLAFRARRRIAAA